MISTNNEWERALEYCRKYGRNSVSYLSLEPDKSLFFSKRVEGVASYSISGRTMLLCGDPVCSMSDLRCFLQEIIEYAEKRRYKIMFLFVMGDTIPIYLEAGLVKFKIGEEAIFDVQSWTMTGHKNAKARSAWHSAVNHGLEVKEYLPWAFRNYEIEQQFMEISDRWLNEKKTAKLQFEVGSLMLNKQCDKRYFYAVDSDGVIQGINTLNPYKEGNGWIIDIMRRRKGCPHGVMELLFHDIMNIIKGEGAEQLSLGAAPFYNTNSGEKPSSFERAGKIVFDHLNHVYGFKPLQEYKAKYNPDWKELYLVTNTRRVSLEMINSACDIIDSEGVIDYLKALIGVNELKRCVLKHNL